MPKFRHIPNPERWTYEARNTPTNIVTSLIKLIIWTNPQTENHITSQDTCNKTRRRHYWSSYLWQQLAFRLQRRMVSLVAVTVEIKGIPIQTWCIDTCWVTWGHVTDTCPRWYTRNPDISCCTYFISRTVHKVAILELEGYPFMFGKIALFL